MNIAILQARMSSTRLPGKVMASVLGQPMIGRQIERLNRATRIDRLIVATSDDPTDDDLAAYCSSIGIEVSRGSLGDVLDRFHGALKGVSDVGAVVRLTADCPLADWSVIDMVIDRLSVSGADYANNVMPERTYPHGLDVEAFRPAALERAWREAQDPYEREHVTPFIYRRPEEFRLAFVSRSPSLAALRWTVDYPSDLAFVCEVYAQLYPRDPAFTSEDIVALPCNSAVAPE